MVRRDAETVAATEEGGAVQLFRRRRNEAAQRREHQEVQDTARRHLEEFVTSRRGVEAFVEPATTMTPPTVLLVAESGEWTRRRVLDPAVVRDLADRHRLPVYDVQLVGYPKRMRQWNERVKRERAGGPEGDAGSR